jgi:hypothetical protein
VGILIGAPGAHDDVMQLRAHQLQIGLLLQKFQNILCVFVFLCVFVSSASVSVSLCLYIYTHNIYTETYIKK